MVRTLSTTRERILNAGFTLFARYGFRRTSMEDIATEAGLSRAALYLQFHNKEDIFRALATDLHEEALAQAGSVLERDERLTERLGAAVEAKTLRMLEIAHTSPHGNELMDEKNRLCGDLATDSEQRFQEMLTRSLTRADKAGEIHLATSGLSAREAAEIFARAVAGLKGPEVTTDAYRARLASFVDIFVRGLGG